MTEPTPPSGTDDAPVEETEGKDGGNDILRFLKELPVLIALALAIALLLKAFVVQAFYIEMQSMEPTLHPGERVLVSKFSYRLGDPHRGDVVIFRDPRHPCTEGDDSPACHPGLARKTLDWLAEVFGLPTGSKDDLVKRIVGLPGETIAMHDGAVYVCSAPGCQPIDTDGHKKDGKLITFPHTATKGPQQDDADLAAFKIPSNSYYVLGDNRAQSADSRSFGSVPRKEFVGKVFVLIWPPTRFQGL